MKRSSLCLLVAALLAATACSQQTTSVERPTLPEGVTMEALVNGSGKADWLTRWFTKDMGVLTLGVNTYGQNTYSEPFHLYRFKLQQGDVISLQAFGSYWGIVGVYRKTAKDWKALASTYIEADANGNGYGATIKGFKAAKSGEHAVVIGSFWGLSPYYKYDLKVDCDEGSCKPTTPYCVTWNTKGSDVPERTYFYVETVDSYEAGKQLLASMSGFFNEQILEGACADQGMMCIEIYKPVCGVVLYDAEKTFGNSCTFQSEIFARSKEDGHMKGYYREGACETTGEQKCSSDADCPQGQECVHNGVFCVMAPCDVSYFICKPKAEVPCQTNDDCKDSFCGWNEKNERICKPWAQVGEHCEGFVMPAYRQFCAPGLTCKLSEPTGDAGGTCVEP